MVDFRKKIAHLVEVEDLVERQREEQNGGRKDVRVAKRSVYHLDAHLALLGRSHLNLLHHCISSETDIRSVEVKAVIEGQTAMSRKM